MGAGLDFDSETAYRDVFLQDKCDEGCLQLARLLGWEVRDGQRWGGKKEGRDNEREGIRGGGGGGDWEGRRG